MNDFQTDPNKRKPCCYFSTGGPCRKYTPALAKWYKSLPWNHSIEVVWLSADCNEIAFLDYFREMPWVAIDYEDPSRELLMEKFNIEGVPRLIVLDGQTGRILEGSVVGKPLDIHQWRSKAANGAIVASMQSKSKRSGTTPTVQPKSSCCSIL